MHAMGVMGNHEGCLFALSETADSMPISAPVDPVLPGRLEHRSPEQSNRKPQHATYEQHNATAYRTLSGKDTAAQACKTQSISISKQQLSSMSTEELQTALQAVCLYNS